MNYSKLVTRQKKYKYSANICFDMKNDEKLAGFIPNQTTTEILAEYLYGIIENIDSVHSRILYGSYGTGKSHLLTVLALLLGHTNTDGEAFEKFVDAIRQYDPTLAEFITKYNSEEKPLIYWCNKCNEPIFNKELHLCSCEGGLRKISEGYIFNPVFAQERKLLSLITGTDYSHTKMWYMGSSRYFYDGEIHVIPYLNWYKEKKHIAFAEQLRNDVTIESDYSEYMGMVEANITYIQGLVFEAEEYICKTYKKYKELNYQPTVSFSGGKDSTVVGKLVRDALQDNTVIHFFGDTTLEFPETYNYVTSGFRKENPTVPMIPSETESDFFKLCKVFGPPSQHERWCCTIFKTSNLNKEIANLPGNSLSFIGIRHAESVARRGYERTQEHSKISTQVNAMPIIDWADYDVWLYILYKGIKINDCYQLG